MEKRKRLRLQQFDYRKNGAYFITICTKNKQQCLSRVVGVDAHIDPYIELTAWGQIDETYLLSIPGIQKYVIMPNHIHLLLRIEEDSGPMWASAPTQSISNCIRSFKTLVSKQIGVSIWQRSFYDHVIRNDEDYLRVWQYTDDNPAKWAEDKYYISEQGEGLC